MLSRILLVVLLMVPVLGFGQQTAKLDEAVQDLAKDGKFMGSVLVARGNELLLNKGYGWADVEKQISNEPQTKFRLASVTKQFTGAAILLLEDQGKLKIDDPIRKYLPDTPAAWDKITIFHLLTHTSGIPSFTDSPDYQVFKAYPATPEQLVARFRDKPLEFAPGEKWNYSNSGYVLLGYLLEKVSGVSYAKFVQENIFAPLGMKDSGYDSDAEVIERRAIGYTREASGPVKAAYIHMSVPYSAGALYSTTEDLLRWELGLFGGKLLKAESLQKMTTPFKSGYALGVGVSTRDGHKVISHNGGIEGFRTHLSYYPEEKLTIAVLGNLESGAGEKIASKLAELMLGIVRKSAKDRTEIAVPVEVLQRYVGTYEITHRVKNYIRLEGDRLTTQLTGQKALQLFAETETKFFLKAVDAQLEFVKNDKGEVTHLVMYQNGRETPVQRVSDKVEMSPEPKVVTVPVERLKEYVGTYVLSPNFEIAITLEGEQLMEQATRQPKAPIFPESETKFFLRVVEAQIEFVRGTDGKVEALILHQNGLHQKGVRK
ncbi:MAG: serine hydrolase [Nibricoccus sp.]